VTTVIENTLPFAPPNYDLNDGGTTRFPHEDQWRWTNDWPFVAEAWQKYIDHAEYRRVRDRQTMVRCRKCVDGRAAEDRQNRIERTLNPEDYDEFKKRSEFPDRLARAHWELYHKGVAVDMDYINPRWIWQMLGFEDHWVGNPTGLYTLIDPRDTRNHQWEYDALELGAEVASGLWEDIYA
jgi:hypothetical protein